MQTNPIQRHPSVPSPAERFEEAIAAMDQAHQSGLAVDIAFARRQLAEVAWNLSHVIVEGLRRPPERGAAG